MNPTNRNKKFRNQLRRHAQEQFFQACRQRLLQHVQFTRQNDEQWEKAICESLAKGEEVNFQEIKEYIKENERGVSVEIYQEVLRLILTYYRSNEEALRVLETILSTVGSTDFLNGLDFKACLKLLVDENYKKQSEGGLLEVTNLVIAQLIHFLADSSNIEQLRTYELCILERLGWNSFYFIQLLTFMSEWFQELPSKQVMYTILKQTLDTRFDRPQDEQIYGLIMDYTTYCAEEGIDGWMQHIAQWIKIKVTVNQPPNFKYYILMTLKTFISSSFAARNNVAAQIGETTAIEFILECLNEPSQLHIKAAAMLHDQIRSMNPEKLTDLARQTAFIDIIAMATQNITDIPTVLCLYSVIAQLIKADISVKNLVEAYLSQWLLQMSMNIDDNLSQMANSLLDALDAY